MLFRRVSQHVREQNWLAVFIDLLIVVVGIFLGLQVNEWNENRLDIKREQEILGRLQADFNEIRTEAQGAIDYHQGIISGLNALLRSATGGSVAAGDEEQLRYGLDSALKVHLGSRRSATWLDLVSSGQTALLRNPELLSALAQYDELHQNAKPLFAQFWEGQRLHEVAFSRHFDYETERRHNGDLYLPAGVAAYDVSAMSDDPEFVRAAHRLAEYQVYYQIWHLQMLQAADKVLASL